MNIPLNIDWQQILLHLFNFVILAGGLYLLLYKPVKKFMAQHTEYYQNMEETAKAKLEKAEETANEYKTLVKNAEHEIEEKRTLAAIESEKMSSQKILEAKQQAEKILSDARQNAELEKSKILESAQKEIADMVTTATEKLLLQSTPSDAFEQFLAAAERSEQSE